MSKLSDYTADSVLRHIIQNQLMKIPVIRDISEIFHQTGLDRSPEKILIYLKKIIELIDQSAVDINNKTVLELGPGKTPDILYCLLLLGAERVIGLDTSNYLKSNSLILENFRYTNYWLEKAILNKTLSIKKNLRIGRYKDKIKIPDSEMKYDIYDGKKFDIKDNSIDIIVSKSVLEHVRFFEEVINETFRVLKPGSISCHLIDLRDHYTFKNKKDWLRFLRYTESLWNLMASNRSSWCNRLRASEWNDLFSKAGFEVVTQEVLRADFHNEFNLSKLSYPFSEMPNDELNICWLNIVCKKPNAKS